MNEPTDLPDSNDKLRKALRNLPKAKTPWYFEARLQQRIRGKQNSPKSAIRAVPAFATVGVVVICAGIIGYLTFLSPMDSSQSIEEAVGVHQGETIVDPGDPVSTEQPSIPPQAESEVPRGPNVGNNEDFVIESVVASAAIEDSADSTLRARVDSTSIGK